MPGFDLPANYHHNPEQLVRRVRQRTLPVQRTVPTTLESPSETTASSSMAEKTIRDYSVPSSNNVLTGPEVNVGDNFELKAGVINMVQASPFYGLASEDANSHLQQFLEYAVPSPSKEHPPTLSDYDSSPSH